MSSNSNELQDSCRRSSDRRRHEVAELAQLQQELNGAVDQLLRGKSHDFAGVSDAMRRSTDQFRKIVRASRAPAQ